MVDQLIMTNNDLTDQLIMTNNDLTDQLIMTNNDLLNSKLTSKLLLLEGLVYFYEATNCLPRMEMLWS